MGNWIIGAGCGQGHGAASEDGQNGHAEIEHGGGLSSRNKKFMARGRLVYVVS